MFLIRRKADGRFFKNGGWGSEEEQKTNWTHNPSKCRPFKSKAGAKQSRGWVKTTPVDNYHELLSEWEDYRDWRRSEQELGNDVPYKEYPNLYRKMTEEESPYEVVEIEVSVTIKEIR